jgi:hypothetical protein
LFKNSFNPVNQQQNNRDGARGKAKGADSFQSEMQLGEPDLQPELLLEVWLIIMHGA